MGTRNNNYNELTTVFRGAERIGTSRNGNPTWMLATDDGAFRTESDASIGYEIGNITNTRLDSCLIGKRVVLSMTKANRVWDVKLSKEED